MKYYIFILLLCIVSQVHANYGFSDHIAKSLINSPQLESCTPGSDIRSDEFTYQKTDASGHLPYIRYYSTALSDNFLIQDAIVDGSESVGGWKDNYSNYLTVNDFGGSNVNRIRMHLMLPGEANEIFFSADVVNGTINNVKRIKSPDPIMYYSVDRDGRSTIRNAFGTVGEITTNHGDTRIVIETNKVNISQTSNVSNVEGLTFIVYKDGDEYYFSNILRGGVTKEDAVYKAVFIRKANGKEISLDYSPVSGTLKRVVDGLGNFIELTDFIKDEDNYSVQYEYPQKIYLGRFTSTSSSPPLLRRVSIEELNASQVINIQYSSFRWNNYKANNRIEKIYAISSVKSTENGYESYNYSYVVPISFQVPVGGILTGKWEDRYSVPSLAVVSDSRNRIMRDITYGSPYSNWYSKITSTSGPGQLFKTIRALEGGFVNDKNRTWEKRYSLSFSNYIKSYYTIYGETKSRIVNMSFDGFPCIKYKNIPVSYVQFDIIDNKINKIVDRNNIATSFTYDTFGRVVSVKEATDTIFERLTSYTYTNEVQGYLTPTVIIKPLKTIKNMLNKGKVSTSTETYKLSNKSKVTSYNWSGELLTGTFLPDGTRTINTYNSFGLLDTETKYKNNIFYSSTNYRGYNSSGQPLKINKNYLTTSISYNANNKPNSITETNGTSSRIKRYNYDVNYGDLLSEVDFDGTSTFYTYNDSGMISKKTTGKVAEIYNYDINGNLLSIDSVDNSTKRLITKSYSTKGELNETRVGNDISKMWTRFSYDNNSNIINKTMPSPDGNTTSTLLNTYDPLNRINSFTDPLNKQYNYKYDESDNIIEYKSPSFISALRVFFKDSEIETDSSNDYGIKTNSYNLGSELLKYSHSNTRECNFDYYNFNGEFSSFNCNNLNNDMDYNVNYNYLYDRTGDILHGIESKNLNNLPLPKFWGANTNYMYDYLNRIIKKSQKVGILQNINDEKILSVDYQYTNADKIKKITYPSGVVIDFMYNPTQDIGIKQININGNSLLTVNYEHNLIKNILWGNGNQSDFIYDDANNLVSNNNLIKGKPNKNINYSYYSEGSLKNKSYGVVSNNYFYDAKGQLVQENRYNNQLLNYSHIYTYDNNGNRTNFIANGLQTPYSFKSATYNFLSNSNRFSSIKHDSNFVNFKYEPTGELQLPDLIGNANYDSYGRRLRQISGLNNQFSPYVVQYNDKNQRVYSGSTLEPARQYVYNEEGNLLGEYNVNGVPYIEYIWLEDQPIAALAGGKVIYILSDRKNIPYLGISSDNNATVWEWIPDAFGLSKPSIETVKINLRFPGQYFDVATKLHYNHNRYYNPSLGRYMEADPTGLNGGWNTYVYAENDPINKVDPTGLIVPVVPLILYAGGLTLTLDGLMDGQLPQVKGATFAGAISKAFRQTTLSQSIKRGMSEPTKVKVHGNKLNNTPAEGYTLRTQSGQIMKFGETTRGELKFGVGNQKRYSQKYIEENELQYIIEITGTKVAMHKWQTENILNFMKNNDGVRPPLNKSNY